MVSFNCSLDSKAKLLFGSVGAALLLGAADGAAGATASTAIMVSVNVEAVCTVSANPLSFGSYQPGLGGLTASTTLAVSCPTGARFTVALDAGTGGGTVTQRQMTFGAYRLQYNLFTTAARTTVWGDGTLSSATVSGVGRGLATGEAIVETVYGQLPDISANQQLSPGVYTDTVRVTVSY